MVCKKCGFQNYEDAMYCSGCGAELKGATKRSVGKKHKFVQGVIAAMMLFAAVMAIVSASNNDKEDAILPTISIPATSVQKVDNQVKIEETKTLPEPVYINEIVSLGGRNGLVWTRSTKPVNSGYEYTNEDAPECWSDPNYMDGGHTSGIVRDNWGNVYKYGIHVDGGEKEAYYFSVDLYGEYTAFTGTVACPERSAAISQYVYNQTKAYTKYFEVYGDDVLLYISPTMRYDYSPQKFTVDITGINRLTIVYPATKGPNEIATIYDGKLS